MNRYLFIIIPALLIFNTLTGQTTIVKCIENDQKNPDSGDPIVVKTCLYKNFKFKTTSFPDFAGRYFNTKHEVYVLVNKKYIKTTNSNVFNKSQGELVSIINKRIQKDFKDFSTDSTTKKCFTGLHSIPIYKMNDFRISFNNDEIWFEVNWDVPMACRDVDGTIISFKLSQIREYLK
ncbi:MAG: hypothetical protein QM726_16885 [Chitinophagaceae bacterium]